MGSQRVGHDWATKHKLLERKVKMNLDSLLKRRNIALPTKVRIVKAMVLLVVTYRCESWTIKKAEHWRADAFKMWCWKRFSKVPWTARRSNQSTLKEINPEYSLEGLIWTWSSNTWATDKKSQLFGKDPDSWKDWGKEGKGVTEDEIVGWHHRFNGHKFKQTLRYTEGQKLGVLQSMESQRVGHNWATEQQRKLNQSHGMTYFLLAHLRLSQAKTSNQGIPEAFPFFHCKAFTLHCLPLSLFQVLVADSLIIASIILALFWHKNSVDI